MQAMVCELCGSTNIVKKDDMFQCQHCGAKYSVEEAKKLIGSVKALIIRLKSTLRLRVVRKKKTMRKMQQSIMSWYFLKIL